MAHSEHNRPKGSGVILIAIGILIFFFAPRYYTKDLVGGMVIMVLGFVLGGIGFYLAFLKRRT
ncbi:conserved hypothetical protein [Nitrosotalea sinensis]|uniref:Uncharacterized protein n=1 Tax=Nitrosotalea sinensis TaxID=1499975 RepID=A0A2H1EIP5_9ARCH|nr:hypothetical protein [Candidatus Nitrosotalea sinensis]SHO47689.1 conserved hypothetical protein [Candidatus Nitrosotalea sinensis]